MVQNVKYIIISYTFVFSVILITSIIQKILKLQPEFSRKLVHISVGNWVFLALFCFSDWYYAAIVPASFIVINYLSYRYRIFKAMELDDKNPGTIYYSISLTILTVLTFIRTPYYTLPYLGILAMVWGDGFASVIGRKYPIRILRRSKSLGGSIAFFIFTFISSVVYLLLFNISMGFSFVFGFSIILALLGVFIELYSPHNMDNLTVPIMIGLIALIVNIGMV